MNTKNDTLSSDEGVEPHLDADELEHVIALLAPIATEYGWRGIEQGLWELVRRALDEEVA